MWLKNNSNIFNIFLNKKYKLTLFNIKKSDTGEIKYLPPVSKEWKNTTYSFYKNEIKNSPSNSININKIIRNYFDLYFKDNQFSDSKYIALWKRRRFLKRIYMSNIELKSNNHKIIITSYILNVGRNILYKKYKYLYNFIQNNILDYWKFKLNNKIKELKIRKNLTSNQYITNNKENIYTYKYKFLSKTLLLYLNLYLTRAIKFSYFGKLKFLRRYQLNYNLNKLKFEKNNLLFKLANILNKILKRKVIFKFINLKSITLNSDIFTNALALKLKKKRGFNVLRGMNSILKRANLPMVNTIIERSRHIKKKDSFLVENRYNDNSIITTINNNPNFSIQKLLNEVFYNKTVNSEENHVNIYNKIFDSIKYKNMGGIRLEVKGRLTKRYRADRAIYKLRWKGGLKNIDSSFKRLSTVMYRGNFKPNVSYSLSKSKRKVGSFAVKGWISGK